MGVTQDKGRLKPRPVMTAQRPTSPRVTAQRPTSPRVTAQRPTSPRVTAPAVTVKATVASTTPPAPRKEEEKLRGTAAQSSVKSMNITTNIINKTKVVLPASEAKDVKKNEDKNETENSLILAIGGMSLNEDNDLNKQMKNLSVNDKQKEKEESEDSDLVSRGPDRPCIRGINRTVPYLHEQHIVSSDKQGGATVLYPNISTPHKVISYTQDPFPEFLAANLQNSCEVNRSLTIENVLNENDYNSEVENLLEFPQVLPNLNAEDVNDVLPSEEENNNVYNLFDPAINDIDRIIQSNTHEEDFQKIKRELWEGAMDKHPAPTTPESLRDSAYDSGASDSDECSVGSPSSVMSGISAVSSDREKIVTMSAPYTHIATQPTNLHSQTVSGFAPVSNSPLIQTVPVPPGMLLVLPNSVMPVLPQSQQQQPVAPPATPPPSPQGLRPILPGINIPAACNKCSEPAINRIKSVLTEHTKERAWALMYTYPDSKFTDLDEDGNMFLCSVLTNWQKIKNFMDVWHALLQRLKGIINRNIEMAHKLLTTPNKNGHTPLDMACRLLRSTPHNALAVRYLADTMVEEGLPIGEEVDCNGNSLLHRLCLCGDEACYIMAELLSMKDLHGKNVFDVNMKNNEGKTPLHIAAQTHNDRTSCAVLAQLLMRSGADVSVKEGCAGNTVFHLVARESCDPNLLLTLLAKTSYATKVINEKNFNEDTPLHMVAANHTISLTRQRLAVQHMIDYGADPRLQNKSRKAPLSLVPAERKPDIKNVLYQKRQVICHE